MPVPFNPILARNIAELSPADAARELATIRAENPNVPILAIVSRDSNHDLISIAAEHADGVLVREDVEDGTLNARVAEIVDAYYDRRGIYGEERDAAKWLALAEMENPGSGAMQDGLGSVMVESEEVGERLLELLGPMFVLDPDPHRIIAIGILAWNSTMQPLEERIPYLRSFADDGSTPAEADLLMATFSTLANRKRALFPHDARMIVDYSLDTSGDAMHLTAKVVEFPEDALVDDGEVIEEPPQRERTGLEVVLLNPLVIGASEKGKAIVREAAVVDEELTRLFSSLLTGPVSVHVPDLDLFWLMAALTAVGWNVGLLPEDDEDDFIEDLAARIGDQPALTQLHVKSVATMRRENYADDQRVIAMVDVNGSPGNFEVSVLCVPQPFDFLRDRLTGVKPPS